MHTNDLVINHGTTWKAVKGVTKLFPHLDREATAAFIVEPIDAVDSCTFVVPPQEEEIFGVFDFVRKQQADHLQRLLATVNIVPQKQVIGLRTTRGEWGQYRLCCV